MGFFESMFNGMVDAGVKSTEDKYRAMSLSELEREWNKVYAHRGFYGDPELEVAAKSPNGILDRIYAERTGRISWRQKAIKHYQEKQRRQQALIEEEKREELRKQAEEKEKEDSLRFKEQLAKSDMAKIIIDKIDSLGDEVEYVAVFPDRVVINDNDYFLNSFSYEDSRGLDNLMGEDDFLCEVIFESYKCPSLNKAQVVGLRMYIEEAAKIKFEFICDKIRYVHKDYTGHLRRVRVVKDSGITASW